MGLLSAGEPVCWQVLFPWGAAVPPAWFVVPLPPVETVVCQVQGASVSPWSEIALSPPG